MRNSLVIGISVTICFIAFVISKIFIAFLLYKRWRRKHVVYEEGYAGRVSLTFVLTERK